MGSRDHSIECETCGMQRGGLNDLLCDCDVDSTWWWATVLGQNMRDSALEEMRVRAAYDRVMKRWAPALRAARMRVPCR